MSACGLLNNGWSGDFLFVANSTSEASSGRRTQRTRRERPHFFDSLEYGTHVRQVNICGACLCLSVYNQ